MDEKFDDFDEFNDTIKLCGKGQRISNEQLPEGQILIDQKNGSHQLIVFTEGKTPECGRYAINVLWGHGRTIVNHRSEHFYKVASGEITFVVNGTQIKKKAGETIEIPPDKQFTYFGKRCTTNDNET